MFTDTDKQWCLALRNSVNNLCTKNNINQIKCTNIIFSMSYVPDLVQTNATQILLKLIVEYNRFFITIKIKIRTYRKQNTTFNLLCELFENMWSFLKWIFINITHTKIAPYDSAWISVCKYLPEGNELSAQTSDLYFKFNSYELKTLSERIISEYVEEDKEQLQIINDKFKIIANHLRHVLPNNNPLSNETPTDHSSLLDCTIYTTGESFIHYRRISMDNDNLIFAKLCQTVTIVKSLKFIDDFVLKNTHLSSVRLLEIEYQCGDLPAITIEIPSSHYIVDNEILSKTYILRYLEHLPIYSNWIFKENDYRVKIIDYDSNVFSINSNQCILIEKDEYKIMHNTPLNNRQNSFLNREKQTHSNAQEVNGFTAPQVKILFNEMKRNHNYIHNKNKKLSRQEDETKDNLKTE